MEPLKIALLGLGQAAQNIHLPALRSLTELFEVVAVCDPDEAAREAAQAALPGARSYANAEELLSSGGFDALDVCSPPAEHCAQACAALEAGLHVFCEKPIGMTLTEADRTGHQRTSETLQRTPRDAERSSSDATGLRVDGQRLSRAVLCRLWSREGNACYSESRASRCALRQKT
jgi:hypothetical protein